MKILMPGEIVDEFEIIKLINSGAMAHIYLVKMVSESKQPAPHFDLIMKIPRMTAHDGAENIISFEVEMQIFPKLTGPHVPRFVCAGELSKTPYLVLEYITGTTLLDWQKNNPHPAQEEIASLGAKIALAVLSLHQQNVCHLDLKPANIIIDHQGKIVLVDFGFSHHAFFPDLLAEEMRIAVGSPAWIAPEQVVGVRGDPRSDIFAIGVILYEMSTGELPFGAPISKNGIRTRLWMGPTPPRKLNSKISPWLQEVILHCLEPEADLRYPSCAHLAFDLNNVDQIQITERGNNLVGDSLKSKLWRYFKAAGKEYRPSAIPTKIMDEIPIVLVAIPHKDVSDQTLNSLREAAERSLGIRPGARLTCVTVIPIISTISEGSKSETSQHRRYLSYLKKWADSIDLSNHQASFHVLESNNIALALVEYAKANHVTMIIMGAASHGLRLQGIVKTVPIKVAMYAPCTVILVKQT